MLVIWTEAMGHRRSYSISLRLICQFPDIVIHLLLLWGLARASCHSAQRYLCAHAHPPGWNSAHFLTTQRGWAVSTRLRAPTPSEDCACHLHKLTSLFSQETCGSMLAELPLCRQERPRRAAQRAHRDQKQRRHRALPADWTTGC